MKEIIYSNAAPEPVGPYSQAILSGDTLYCSGQIAMGHLDEDVAAQTKTACENVRAVLKAADMELENVVKTTCFLADIDDFAIFNGIYEKYFGHKPARSCVAAKALPKGALVEIEVIAVK